MSQNITIAVRIRPQNKREKGQPCLVKMTNNKIIIKTPQNFIQKEIFNQTKMTFNDQNQDKVFEFSRCYWSYDDIANKIVDNKQVYDDLGQQLIKNVFDGYNSTIFAYGQTGSGKSYSMEGQDGVEKGILQLSLCDIFNKKNENNKTIETSIFVSYLEIYNEEIRDLLDPSKKNLKIYSTQQGVMVQNLSKILCENLQDVLKLLDDGKKIRVVGSHAMNIKSSRSHAIFMILLKQKQGQQTQIAKLNIVDLAGSERYSKTQSDEIRMQEGSNINKSLTFLGMVIENLAANQTKGSNLHIPYRNSQLTHLLSESLCGNSKTFMIAAISGAEENYEETVSTLRFAERVQCIKTNSKQNITDEEVKQKEQLVVQIAQMKKQISEFNKVANQTSFKFMQDDAQIKELDKKKIELEERLKYNEILLQDTTKSLEEERQQKLLLEQNRAKAFQDAGVLIGGLIKGIDKESPYLMNMSDDPSLAGCLIFYLKIGESKFGSSKDCDFIISGLGIKKNHCILKNYENSKISLIIIDDGKVLVNGAFKENKKNQEIVLEHLNKIIIGHDNSYKLIIPKQNKNKQVLFESNTYDEFFQARISQTSEESKNLKKLIEDVQSKLNSQAFNKFMNQLQEALKNVDQANEITIFRYRKFPIKSNNILFNLEILREVYHYSQMKINFAVSIKNRENDQICFIWKYLLFCERFEDMLLWYSHQNNGNILNTDNYNPWSEAQYQQDLTKLSTKELYKYWQFKLKKENQNMIEFLKEKEKIIVFIQNICQKQKFNVNEDDIESYADIYFREFFKQDKDKKLEQMKIIPQINYFIKQYMEICAELTMTQMQKYESTQKLDRIVLQYKREQKMQINDNFTTTQSSMQSYQSNLSSSTNGSISQKSMKIDVSDENIQKQFQQNLKLIPYQQDQIEKLNQENQSIRQIIMDIQKTKAL